MMCVPFHVLFLGLLKRDFRVLAEISLHIETIANLYNSSVKELSKWRSWSRILFHYEVASFLREKCSQVKNKITIREAQLKMFSYTENLGELEKYIHREFLIFVTMQNKGTMK
jgi:hypothetical protein